jgi:UDP-N-acetylmuramate--alanine ligase
MSVYHKSMHIFFSGIGGMAIGPLAQIAHQAGYEVSGSDKQSSIYIDYLKSHGVEHIKIDQSWAAIEQTHERSPIDWYVYSSAVAIEQPDSDEFRFCHDRGIKMSKRDELLQHIINDKNLKMIAVAGTHGKTTTTAMAVWLMQQLGMPVSYSVGAKLSFGEMGHFDPRSDYFVYEADEYDRNFLSFQPFLSIITGIDWDHPDIYPTRQDYYDAFRQFIAQCQHTLAWEEDANRLKLDMPADSVTIITMPTQLHSKLVGEVNRQNALIVARAVARITSGQSTEELLGILNQFPGVSRRFEKLATNLYTDYAHTPEKIRGAVQIAKEAADSNVVVVYEGLHNTRQHFIKEELPSLFRGVKQLYIVPSYRAREDETLEDLTPKKLAAITQASTSSAAARLDEQLWSVISEHTQNGDLVLCLSAGGGGSLDEWLRKQLNSSQP